MRVCVSLSLFYVLEKMYEKDSHCLNREKKREREWHSIKSVKYKIYPSLVWWFKYVTLVCELSTFGSL